MQVVIEIDDNLYVRLFDNGVENYDDALDMEKAIRKGTPLPKGHGDLIDKEHIITRIENERDYFNGMITDIFDRRYAQGLNEAAIKVSEEKAVIPAEQEVD